jgi:hypothetical protein
MQIFPCNTMNITEEMKEILRYLNNKDNYALFAGFAAFLCTGIESSPDIDIFVLSYDDVKKITEDFISSGWDHIQFKTDKISMSTVKKNKTTFDIIFSQSAKKFFPSRIVVSLDGKKLFCISLEALLLTKLNQLAAIERSEEKTKRDRSVIRVLREKIDVTKLNELLHDLEDSFWTEGEWDPEELRGMLIEFIETTGFEGVAPLPKEVRSTVATTTYLPRIVEY